MVVRRIFAVSYNFCWTNCLFIRRRCVSQYLVASVHRQFTQVGQIAQKNYDGVQKLYAQRPFGKPVEQFYYVENSVLPNTEDKTFEYKALTKESPQKLPWKIMDKARTFICGILNGGGQGIIYFGIGDSYDPSTNYKRGQIIGLDIEDLRDEISKAFQSTLNDHIKSDYGKMTKGGDMNCVNLHFVPIRGSEEPTSRYVVEIEVKREWMFCQDHVYYFQKWTEKRPNERGANNEKCGLHDLYEKDRNNWEDPVIRTHASSESVKAIDVARQVKEPLSLKYKEWQGHTSSPFNCHDLCFKYWPRKELDEDIQKIQKGKIKVLHGTIGTGKTTAARNYIQVNKEKFDIRWHIDVSKGEDSIIASLADEARSLGVSYDKLFQTVKGRARKDIIFLLDNVQNNLFLGSKWFPLLWDIRKSAYIIITTNSDPSGFRLVDAENFPVGKFDEALEFLKDSKEISNKSEKDLKDLCEEFGWNILGLTVARDYMMNFKLTAWKYLERLRGNMITRNYRGDSGELRTLYHSIRLCLLDVRDENFAPIATTSFISNNKIPEFLLSNQLSSNEDDNYSENEARLDDIHDQLKSLVHIEKEFDIRFFTYHPFTRHVIRDMIDEKGLRKEDLLCKLALTFVRYISKDNRFPKGHFLQRVVREHVEIFIPECKEQKDDRTLIALARLSELVGFTYSQQQPPLQHTHFERARDLLHKLCEITKKDYYYYYEQIMNYFKDIYNSITNKDQEMFGITDNDRNMFGIADKHLAFANRLFTKLTKKSSELSICMIKELVFLRTVNEQDLAMFPEDVKETVKEKIRSSKPLSPSDVEVFVNNKVAYSVHAYRELFLPELYLSVIYSFGRNYFYGDRATLKHSSVYYIDLLKLAYCLSRAISEKMNQDEAVFHEYAVQSYGLLYLLVNDNDISEDGTHKKKERQAHVRDLRNAINRYQGLICDDRRFFEMGMLKRTKDDTYSELKCYLHIVKCYKTLLSLTADEDDIIKGVEMCEHALKILQAYDAPNSNADQTKEHPIQYSKHMNAIAEFYLSTNAKEHISKAIENFAEFTDKQAKKYDDGVTAMFHLEALVCLADGFSRIGEYKRSMSYLERYDNEKNLLELKRQNPHIQKRIDNIRKHVMSRLDEATTSSNFDDTDP